MSAMGSKQQRNLHYLAMVYFLLSSTSPAADGQIRLTGSGTTQCSGRVEIYYNNIWGTVCDDDWDLNDAEVVCRQLGCGTALTATHSARFGQGTGQIWLDDVACSGSERSVTLCQHSGFGTHDCGHGEDAGVVCLGFRLAGSTLCSGHIWGKVCDWAAAHLNALLQKPSISMNPAAEVTWGQNVGITCSVSTQTQQILRPTFILKKASSSVGETQTSSTNSATFNIPKVNFDNEGSYQCQYKITVSGQDVTSSSDSVRLSVTVSLPKPRISMNPVGEVNWGQDVSITCLISTQVLGGTFTLQHSSGSSRKTETSTNSATFNIVQVDFHNEGLYQCQYQTRSPSQEFISPQSNVVRLSVSVSLPKPRISMNPVGEVTWGQDVGITCLISTQVLGGTFILQHSSGSSRKTETRTNSATFNIVQVDFHNEGSYQCQYQTRSPSQEFISPQSNVVRLSVSVPLQQPSISLTSPNRGLVWGPEGAQITRGFSFVFTCSTSSHYPGGVFHLIFSGSNLINTEPAGNQSASFSFLVAEYEQQGNYSCVYEVTLSSRRFTSTQTAPIRVVIKVPLQQPSISLTSPNRGLVWGPEGAQITRGFSFVFTCSTSSHYPGGVFHLIFSGSNLTNTEPAVNQSASFSFPVAEYEQQGNYSCVYEVTVSSRRFTSTQTAPIRVDIKMHLLPLVSSVAAGGLLLLLLVLVVVCLVCKRRRRAKHTGALVQTQLAVRVRNDSVDKEYEDDESDYENVDPVDTKKNLKEEAGKGEEEETIDYVVPESDEDHDYEEEDPRASIIKTNKVYFSVEDNREEEEDNEDDYENVDPMDTTKNLKEEAGKGEEVETNDYVEPESDEDHDYEEAGPSASIMKTEVYFSVEENREEEEEEEEDEDDYENDYEN